MSSNPIKNARILHPSFILWAAQKQMIFIRKRVKLGSLLGGKGGTYESLPVAFRASLQNGFEKPLIFYCEYSECNDNPYKSIEIVIKRNAQALESRSVRFLAHS